MTPKLISPRIDMPNGLYRFLMLTTALASFAFAGGLAAQQTPTDNDDETEGPTFELDEFEVTSGIRESLGAGVEVKKSALQMVDAIFAEDIGKFPDNNVVEALQRVPGVQTTDRTRGEVNTVTIRGFNDIATTINGRNIFTTTGRSVALADVPAALLYRVDVYKTRSASQLEQGIAGVIDIKTQRPFYIGEERVVLAARGIYSELADELDPNISGVYTNVWETDAGRFGLLVNLAFARTNWTDKSITAGAMVPFVTENPPSEFTFGPLERVFATQGSVAEDPIWQPGLESGLSFQPGATISMTPVAGGSSVDVPYYLSRDAVFSSDFYGKRKRPAVNVSLQWAPNDSATYTFEAFYNGYREEWQNNLMFSFADWWGALGADPASSFQLYPETNIIKERVVGFPYMFLSGDKTVQSTDSYLYAVSGDWKIGDNLSITADLSYQTSKFDTEFQAIRTDWVPYNITVDFNDHNGVPAWAFGDDPATADVDESDLTNPAFWNVAQFYDNAGRDEGDAIEFKTDAEYRPESIDFLDKINFGLRYDTRGATAADYFADLAIDPVTDAPYGVRTVSQPLADHPEWQRVNTGYYDGRADIPSEVVVVDADYLHNNADEFRQIVGYPTPYLNENFDITEKTFAAYAQTDFRFDFGAQTLSGQIGVRYVNVKRDLTFASSSDSTEGNHFLPSAVLLYDLNDHVRLRASYGETLRYPDFSALNPTTIYSPDVTNIGYGTATGGNPNLKPTESKNYDLSLEYYFGKGNRNLIYATVFRREIDGLVVDFVNRVTYQNYPYILTQPDNSSNGTMDGWEFGLVWFPDNLPEWLDGFGVQASYTILDSEQDIPIQNSAGDIIGSEKTPFFAVSDSSYSVVLAYEKRKYAVRLSYVWRDDFLHHYEARQFANPLGVYDTAQKSLDLQISYNVTDNFTLTFDATNLTDEEFHSYYADPSQGHNFSQTHNFGNWLISRTFAVGARYSF